MRIGFRFHRGDRPVTLWTTVPTRPGEQALGSQHGAISDCSLSYADFEINQCTVNIENPSDDLVRHMLTVCTVEATPLDIDIEYVTGSLWVHDPRISYEPVPMFHGVILSMSVSDGPPEKMTITLLDFRRLLNLTRDVQDYQNMSDEDIAVMLFSQLSKIGNDQTGGAAIEAIVVDQEARRAQTTSASDGSVRRFNARLLDASLYEKVVYYAYILGFKVTAGVARHPTTKEAYTRLSFVALNDQGSLAAKSGDKDYSYRRGDNEVIDFNRQYDPPGNVMQRNVNNKRFDPLNETFVLENAGKCVDYDKNVLKFDAGDDVPPGSIRGQIVPTDAKTGKPLTLQEYTNSQKGQFGERLRTLGMGSSASLTAYQQVVAFRKGVNIPGVVPGPVVDRSGAEQGVPSDLPAIHEQQAASGSLYWRLTGKLTVKFNPLLTTTDYLTLKGWGVWDGTWAIRSFTHQISSDPRTTFDLTFGNPTRVTG